MSTKWSKKAFAMGSMLTLATLPAVNELANCLSYLWTAFDSYSTSHKELTVIYSYWAFLVGFIKRLYKLTFVLWGYLRVRAIQMQCISRSPYCIVFKGFTDKGFEQESDHKKVSGCLITRCTYQTGCKCVIFKVKEQVDSFEMGSWRQ